MQRITTLFSVFAALVVLNGCGSATTEFDCAAFLGEEGTMIQIDVDMTDGSEYGQKLLSQYTSFRLTTDLSVLSENECRMLPHLFAAADEMESIFWKQAYGDRDALLAAIEDPALREYAKINYGP